MGHPEECLDSSDQHLHVVLRCQVPVGRSSILRMDIGKEANLGSMTGLSNGSFDLSLTFPKLVGRKATACTPNAGSTKASLDKVSYPSGVTKNSMSGHSGPEVESSARGSSEFGNSLGSSERAKAIPSASYVAETACMWTVSPSGLLQCSHSRWWSRAQSPSRTIEKWQKRS